MNEHADHSPYEDDLAAYLLDALTRDEARAMERHIAGCARCQERARWLQASVELLPTSVEQLEPPPQLRERLMADRPCGGRRRRRAAARPGRRCTACVHGGARAGWAGCSRSRGPPRARRAAAGARSGVVGYAAGTGGDGTDATTVQAQVDPSRRRSGDARARRRPGDPACVGPAAAPQPDLRGVAGARQAVRPAGLFQVDRSGRGAAAIPTRPRRTPTR